VLLLICGLSGFFIVELVKTYVPTGRLRKRPATWKIVLALLGSLAVSVIFFPHRWQDALTYGVGGAGLAVMIHRVARLAWLAGDWVMASLLHTRRPR
jgi:hypothetical protein